MRAIRFHTHGGVEVLQLEDVPTPPQGPGEALVRVRACALNHLDLWQRRGIEHVKIPLPHIPGSDVAGEVLSSDGGLVAPGTRVLLQPGLGCGCCANCVAGADNLCAAYDIVGYRSDGGYAEIVKVPIGNLVPIPEAIDFVHAAAFPLTFLTAWHMLITRARVRPGEAVLVLGAGSGVGQAAIQLARVAGARVFATVGTPEGLRRAADLGVEAVINHRTDSISTRVRALTDGRGVDVVVEHVGEATWTESLQSLAHGGRLVTCGATTGAAAAFDLRFLFRRQLSLLGSFMGTRGELLEVARLFFAGRLSPVIDRTFALEAAAEAQRWLEDRRHFGKVVLTVD